jgi:hypothetical protein
MAGHVSTKATQFVDSKGLQVCSEIVYVCTKWIGAHLLQIQN